MCPRSYCAHSSISRRDESKLTLESVTVSEQSCVGKFTSDVGAWKCRIIFLSPNEATQLSIQWVHDAAAASKEGRESRGSRDGLHASIQAIGKHNTEHISSGSRIGFEKRSIHLESRKKTLKISCTEVL